MPLDAEPNPNSNQTAPALMLDAVAAEAARRVDEFRPRELVVLIWALAASRRPASELLGAAAPMVAARAPHLDLRTLVAMAWEFYLLVPDFQADQKHLQNNGKLLKKQLQTPLTFP